MPSSTVRSSGGIGDEWTSIPAIGRLFPGVVIDGRPLQRRNCHSAPAARWLSAVSAPPRSTAAMRRPVIVRTRWPTE